MNVGELIRHYREDVLDMTQEELGERLGIAKATVQKYERGKVKNIPRENIEGMAEIFGIDPSELMRHESEEDIPCCLSRQCHGADGEEVIRMYLKLSETDQYVIRCMLSYLSQKKEYQDFE